MSPVAAIMPEKRMNRKEEALFLAMFSDELRAIAHEGLRDESIFVTDLAAELARSILAAFPSIPPTDPPSVWLSHLDSEEARERLTRLTLQSTAVLTAQTVQHALAQLRSERDLRLVAPLKIEANADDAKLREINERLRDTKTERHRLLNERQTKTSS